MTTTIRFRRGARSRRGGVLVLSLVAAGVVALLCVTFLQLNASIARGQIAAVDTKAAFYLAEAGLAEAYSGMMVGRTGQVGSEERPARLGDGLLWVEAEPIDAQHVELQAVGMVRTGTARLGLVVRRGDGGHGALGMFSESDVTVGDGSLVDGYDSRLGDYATQALLDPESVKKGRLASNGNVTVVGGAAGTEVHGEVVVGPDGSLITVGRPEMSGSVGNSSGPVLLAPVSVPEIAGSESLVHAPGPALYVPSGTFAAEALVLEPDAEVVLQGPLAMTVGSLSVASGAEILIDVSEGEVRLFVEGALEVAPGGSIATSEPDPTQVEILVAGAGPVALAGDGPFHGLVYAPDAPVTVGAGFEVFGGLVSEALVLEDGARLHHDVALAEEGAEDELPRVLAWRILELEEGATDLASADPFVALAVDPATLPPPAAAHGDQELSITYVDSGGVTRSYEGPESGFDWGLVEQVVALVRSGGVVLEDVVDLALLGVLNLRL